MWKLGGKIYVPERQMHRLNTIPHPYLIIITGAARYLWKPSYFCGFFSFLFFLSKTSYIFHVSLVFDKVWDVASYKFCPWKRQPHRNLSFTMCVVICNYNKSVMGVIQLQAYKVPNLMQFPLWNHSKYEYVPNHT